MNTSIDRINKRTGVAGQYAYDVSVTYWHHDAPAETSRVTFVSSAHGAPVVMVLEDGTQTVVDDWRRYGDRLTPAWVRRFYGVAGP